MVNVLVLAADAYRMIDALRDYADILEAEGSKAAETARRAAERIESGARINNLVEVERFDLDAAHSSVIGVLVARRERAEALKAEAEVLEAEAKRAEDFLAVFTV